MTLLYPPPPEEKPPPPGLFGTSFLEGWKRKFGAGINGSRGATETFDLNMVGRVEWAAG